jgi:hypothetical protein
MDRLKVSYRKSMPSYKQKKMHNGKFRKSKIWNHKSKYNNLVKLKDRAYNCWRITKKETPMPNMHT